MATPQKLRGDDDERSTAPRKPYHKPELHVYGDLATITQSNLGSHSPDGAGHPNKHFTS